jgi:hypothetical protein
MVGTLLLISLQQACDAMGVPSETDEWRSVSLQCA